MVKPKRVRVKKLKTHIEGLDEVIKLVAELGDAAAEALDKAAKAGAEIVLSAAKQKVPVDTGELRDSLILKKSRTRKPNIRSQYYVTKKSGAEHFAPVELGTSKMKAQPFLRPAIDENKRNIAKTVNDEMLRAVGRIK
jgi:HK97 gp10 family phage protein